MSKKVIKKVIKPVVSIAEQFPLESLIGVINLGEDTVLPGTVIAHTPTHVIVRWQNGTGVAEVTADLILSESEYTTQLKSAADIAHRVRVIQELCAVLCKEARWNGIKSLEFTPDEDLNASFKKLLNFSDNILDQEEAWNSSTNCG